MKYFGSLVLVLLFAANATAAEQKKSGDAPRNRATAAIDRGASVATPATPLPGSKKPTLIQPDALLYDYLQYRQCVAATGLTYVCAVHFLI